MTRVLGIIALLVFLAMPTFAGDPASKTFAASREKAWTVTESVLKKMGWEIKKSDQAGGWIDTESRSVDFEEYGVYAVGTRHRLEIRFKAAGVDRTTVTVERELFKRERILWIDKDEPLITTDQSVEKDVLAAIENAL
jgi:hypothetical protein